MLIKLIMMSMTIKITKPIALTSTMLIALSLIVGVSRAGVLDNTGGDPLSDDTLAWTGEAGPISALTTGNWSIIAWLHQAKADRTPGTSDAVLSIDAAPILAVTELNELAVTLPTTGGPLTTALPTFTDTGDAAGHVPTDTWMLVVISWTAPPTPTDAGTLTITARSEIVPGSDDAGIIGARTTSLSGPVGATIAADAGTSTFTFGGPLRSWIGARSIVVRNHVMTDIDIDAVWSERSITSAYAMDTTSTGGTMTGADGAMWTAGMFHPSAPKNGGITPIVALVDDPVLANNVVVVSTAAGIAPDSLEHARPTIIGAASTFHHRDVYDDSASFGGFFIPRRDFSAGTTQSTSGVIGARTAAFADGDTTGVFRVLSWSNSRGVALSTAGGRTLAENHAQAWCELRRDRQIGGLNHPVMLVGTKLFGRNNISYGNFWKSGNIHPIYGSYTIGQRAMYQRFWSGGGIYAPTQGAVGPGGGALLFRGGAMQLACNPEPGSALDITGDLEFEFYALVAGVGSRFTATPVKSTAFYIEGEPLSKSTEYATPPPALTHTMGSLDSRIDDDTLRLYGDFTTQITPGQLMYVNDTRPTYNSINRVVSATYLMESTYIEFEFPFLPIPATPVLGQTLTFAEAQVERFRFRLPALQPGDPAVCRGVRIQNTGKGVVALYGFSFWMRDTPGELHGPVGWGGAGFSTQVPSVFAGAHDRMFELLDPDIVFAHPADQLTDATWWTSAVDTIRTGVEDAEVVLVATADMSPTDWDLAATDDAFTTALDVYGVSLRDHPNLGDKTEMYARFAMKDIYHWSTVGNVMMADAMLGYLQGPADPLFRHCPGDLAPRAADGTIGDGVVDIDDLLAAIRAMTGEPERAGTFPIAAKSEPANPLESTSSATSIMGVLANWGSCD